jgi:hypothetical protein
MYTYTVSYERVSSFTKNWVTIEFPTTDDAVEIHREVLSELVERGEIRDLKIKELEVI